MALEQLEHFSGTDVWYRHTINRNFLYTRGIQYVAEKAGAYWLLDEIALENMFNKKVKKEEFQVWKLEVTGSAATLICEDGNEHRVYQKEIAYTDFPQSIKFFFSGDTLMLPNEY